MSESQAAGSGARKKKSQRMVKPLTFKGDKKPKKRKREHREDGEDEAVEIEVVEEEGGVEDEVCKLLLIIF